MPNHRPGYGATFVPAGTHYSATPYGRYVDGRDYRFQNRLDAIQRAEYERVTGREPRTIVDHLRSLGVTSGDQLQLADEQWRWPNAKLRKHGRMTLEQVAGLTVAV